MLGRTAKAVRSSMSRVKLVLFDAFDTLITPRLPIHIQYAEEAQKAGLSVEPDAARSAFRSAFKATTVLHPEWGRHAQPTPMTPEEWWTVLIRETMIQAGQREQDVDAVMPELGPSLLDRFTSREGYRAFDDVVPALATLNEMGVKTGVVSNADSRILKTLSALTITPLLTAPSTISQCCGHEKPSPKIFSLAVSRATSSEEAEETADTSGVIMVGDELEADYHGAIGAGLEARLLRRPGEWSDGTKRSTEAEEQLAEKAIRVIRSLDELVDEVRQRNA